jgi:hypothetical protein
MSDLNTVIPAAATRRSFLDSRWVQAGFKAWRLIRLGKTRLLVSVPLYRCWWRLRGLDFGIVSVAELGLDPDRACCHKDGGGPLLCDLLNQLQIKSTDVVLDLGSGKGGAMVTLARYPFKAVHGVEISPGLVDAARKNLAKLNLRQAAVYCADAATFTDLDNYTYLFMFNPFPGVILRQVLANFEASLRRKPRTVRVVYSNPLHEQIILSTGTFERTFRYEPYEDYRIYVYENRPAQ